MTKMLTGLALLFAFSPLGCSSEEEVPPDPLATSQGFCRAWAEAACPAAVVEACDASSAEDCIDTQSDFCLGILPEEYDSTLAKECIGAVAAAYADANLSAEDIQVVLKLAQPCDRLSKGSVSVGDTCTANAECNTAGGYSCIFKQGASEGTCHIPEEVGPGEPCDGPAQVCGEDNYCNGDNCVAFKAEGRACTADYECSPVDRCVIEVEGDPGLCTARAARNEPCQSDTDCQSQYCLIDPATLEGECASTIRLSRSEPLCDALQ